MSDNIRVTRFNHTATQRHTRWVTIEGQEHRAYQIRYDTVTGPVEVTIDIGAICKELGNKALCNKTGRSRRWHAWAKRIGKPTITEGQWS